MYINFSVHDESRFSCYIQAMIISQLHKPNYIVNIQDDERKDNNVETNIEQIVLRGGRAKRQALLDIEFAEV